MQCGKSVYTAFDINGYLSSRRLCIQIPRAGGRLIERGDEGLFEFDFGDGMCFRTHRLLTNDGDTT
jgi:hypothetical protein